VWSKGLTNSKKDTFIIQEMSRFLEAQCQEPKTKTRKILCYKTIFPLTYLFSISCFFYLLSIITFHFLLLSSLQLLLWTHLITWTKMLPTLCLIKKKHVIRSYTFVSYCTNLQQCRLSVKRVCDNMDLNIPQRPMCLWPSLVLLEGIGKFKWCLVRVLLDIGVCPRRR
jgi:hypothetical protein